MSEPRWRWWTIEHTADLAVEIEASTLEELFLAGAHGMAGVLRGREAGGEEPEASPTVWRELALEALDPEALLVDWLRELLYTQTVESLVFTTAVIEVLSGGRLVARAGFRPPGAEPEIERELKGVTYHDLRVGRRDSSWYARVVFDL
jgi:SHS2 domain-containing protein